MPPTLHAFERERDSLPDADAHGGESELAAIALQFLGRGERQPRAGHAEGVAERDHIALALRQIPLKYAAPLVLHSVHGLSYREIAEALGLTPGAAAVRLTRARDLFAKAYEAIKGGETR